MARTGRERDGGAVGEIEDGTYLPIPSWYSTKVKVLSLYFDIE